MEDLKTWLLENRSEDVAKSLVSHLTSWALGRSLSFADSPQVDDMAAQIKKEDYRMQSVIRTIVKNELFLNR